MPKVTKSKKTYQPQKSKSTNQLKKSEANNSTMATQALQRTRSRILGALLGVHAGDSLGATLEFDSWKLIKRKYPTGLRDIIGGGMFEWPAGHATDDTDMTRALLLAYRDREAAKKKNEEDFDVVKQAADYCLQWYQGPWVDRAEGQYPVDIGGATRIGLEKYSESRDPADAGAGKGSAGNGSLMRCIPTALFTHDAAGRKEESMAISAVTHNDKRCTVSCAAYNEIVAALVAGKNPEEAVEIGKEVAVELKHADVEAAIERGKNLSIIDIVKNGPGNTLPDHTSGYVLQSLSVALAALLDPRPLDDVLVDVVRIGGDTDTNGAIAGGLLGARDGVDAIPQRWLDKLQFRREFEEIVAQILDS
jgi:ADP-ribosylglycohydrolase